MEHLKQIEDELNLISIEVGKKYPEVIQASATALKSLRIIREAYVANVVRGVQSSSVSSTKFLLSSELCSPYIIICNYSDCSPKLLYIALGGLQQLLKHELIPVSDYQNILRVLIIQAQLSTRQDSLLKILQIVVQITTSFLQSNANILFINEIIMNNLLSISLSLVDSRYPPSVVSAAQGTVRQIVGLVVDIPTAIGEAMFQGEVLDRAIEGYSFVLKEMLFFSAEVAGTMIKLPFSPRSLAIDCCYELLKGWARIIKSFPSLLLFIASSVEATIFPRLHSIQIDYLVIASKGGVTLANSFVFGLCRIFRTLITDIEYAKESFINSLLESLFLGLQPCGFDQLPSVQRQRFAEENRTEEFSLMTKFFPMAAQVMGKANPLASNLSIPTTFRHLFSEDCGMVFTLSRNDNRSVNTSNEDSIRFVSSHTVACCLDIVLTILAKIMLKNPIEEEDWRFCFNAATKLVVSSCEYISSLFAEPKYRRNMAKMVAGSQLPSSWGFYKERLEDFDPVGSLHSIIANSSGLKLQDTLVFAVLTLRIAMNAIERLLLLLTAFSQQNSLRPIDFQFLLLPSHSHCESYDICANDLLSQNSKMDLLRIVQSFMDVAKESMIESFHHIVLLSGCRFLSEEICLFIGDMAIVFAFLNDTRSLDLIITAICQHSISLWHGGDLAITLQKVEESFDGKPIEVNSQLLILLMKLLSAVGNYCGDWDCVADCLNQSYGVVSLADKSFTSFVAVQSVLEQIVQLTPILREENLVKFMTSFVSLSAMDLEMMQGCHYSYDSFMSHDFEKILKENVLSETTFVSFTRWGGPLSFSFSVVVSTAKLNCFRISSIWQMVSSHIRLVANSRFAAYRKLATASLFEILVATISILKGNYQEIPVSFLSDYSRHLHTIASGNLVHLLPTNSILIPDLSIQRCYFGGAPPLSQKDLLGSLVSLMSLEAPDVRQNIVDGVHFFLQHVGPVLTIGDSGGWRSILEILSIIPASLLGASDDENKPWSHSCLIAAFSTVKIACEEFLETLFNDENAITAAMKLLQAFASQKSDVNISLTAVETMWKISGFSNNKNSENQKQVNGGLLFECLVLLVNDDRPDVRHCALNTLFMALSSNVEWSISFVPILDAHVLPLLSSLHGKLVSTSREQPLPVSSKTSLHHSRDSTFKQWTETLVLFHRGLLRTIRSLLKTSPDGSIVRTLVPRLSYLVVKGAAVEMVDHETFLSCIDFLFGTLGVCLEMESNDGEFTCLKIIQAMKLIALGGCGGNRDGSMRIMNNISKLFAEEKSFRMCTILVRQACVEVAVALLLNVMAEQTSPLQRVQIRHSQCVSEDDVNLRKSFFSLVKFLQKDNLYPSYVLRLFTMLYFYRTPRFVAIEDHPLWICLPSNQLLADIEKICSFERSQSSISETSTSLQGAACAMSICNQAWIAECVAKFPIFDEASVMRILFPHEVYLSLGLNIAMDMAVSVESYEWRSSAPVLKNTRSIFLHLVNELLSCIGEKKSFEDTNSVVVTTMILTVICPWSTILTVNNTNCLDVSKDNDGSLLIENDICGLLRNVDGNSISFCLVHKAIVSGICYGLLIVEKEKSSSLDISVTVSLSQLLNGYCSIAEDNLHQSIYFGLRLVLRQIFNTIIATYHRQELSQNSFLIEIAEKFVKVVKSRSLEVLTRSKFWAELLEFVDQQSPRTYGLFQRIVGLNILQGSVEEMDIFDVQNQDDYSLIDFYHQFIILSAILNSGPLKDHIIDSLSGIDVPNIIKALKNQKAEKLLLEQKVESLQRELQNTTALSAFPF